MCAAAGAAGGTLVEMNALCLDCGQWCHRDDILYFLKMLSWGETGKREPGYFCNISGNNL